jgi:hypothetical protein
MPRTINQSPLLARVGLLDRVEQYSAKQRKFYPDIIGETFSTKQAYEEMLLEGDFGMAPVVNETSPTPFDDFQTPYSKRYYPLMRSIGFTVSKQAKYTDLYGIVAKPAKKLALAMIQTKEQKVANIINNATNTATTWLGPDGKPFAATDHPLQTGTGANRPSEDLAFGYLALAQAYQEMGLTESHRGNPMPLTGPFKVFGSFHLMDRINRVIGSPGKADSADRDSNEVAEMVAGRPHINPYFTFTTGWGLIDTTNNPIFMLNRIPLGTDEDYDIVNKVHLFTIEEEYEANFKDWRGFWFTPGS